ncbi:histidine phosphatase family protein [Arthrobacter castelli]|uniref:histidine phosphatase family protein n=1 Tax=Arthrobacter castelli TaxID=271431 RepID=UPI0004025103|nr:histidine phosphatase family protein [Arthrobacter castelli]
MRLILVRHGQTSSNVGGFLDTERPGADLTGLGREQAAKLIDVLGREPIEAIYASTLVRTQQTAAPLAELFGLQTQVRDGLREISAGELEMLSDEASIRTYLETIFAWGAGKLEVRMPGGETGTEVFDRYDEVIAEAAGSGAGTAVVVSHGAVIRSWAAGRVDNITTDYAGWRPLNNTGAVILEGDPGTGWHALDWEGEALGGPGVDTPATDGPAGEPVDVDQ